MTEKIIITYLKTHNVNSNTSMIKFILLPHEYYMYYENVQYSVLCAQYNIANDIFLYLRLKIRLTLQHHQYSAEYGKVFFPIKNLNECNV